MVGGSLWRPPFHHSDLSTFWRRIKDFLPRGDLFPSIMPQNGIFGKHPLRFSSRWSAYQSSILLYRGPDRDVSGSSSRYRSSRCYLLTVTCYIPYPSRLG